MLVLAIPGIWVYMSITAPVLHPNPQAAPSMTDSTPAPKWAGVVERAWQIVRARLSEENLPGVSVAAGIGGDIVWAEGFGLRI
jgi:CubicO group peptidase (beta-lactamase class C family)